MRPIELRRFGCNSQKFCNRGNLLYAAGPTVWLASSSEDTELRCLMELEVCQGKTEVYAGVQA
jgi:hypothetical protein